MATLVNYKCKRFIELTPGATFCGWHHSFDNAEELQLEGL